MSARAAAILLAASAALWGAEREFDQVTKDIEQHYEIRRLHIPLMGLANFALKVGHPAGTSGLKLAIFKDLDESSKYGDMADLDHLMQRAAAGSLHPLIRVRSQSGEATYIFTGDAGKSTRVLIATFHPREATVIEVRVNMDTLMKMVANPEGAGGMFEVKDPWWDR